MTITIQVGNSDDKLDQEEWYKFVQEVDNLIVERSSKIHFFGGPPNYSRYQNVTWVINSNYINLLKEELTEIRKKYRQNSVAWTEGTTVFI